jgi:hypothetical protein
MINLNKLYWYIKDWEKIKFSIWCSIWVSAQESSILISIVEQNSLFSLCFNQLIFDLSF